MKKDAVPKPDTKAEWLELRAMFKGKRKREQYMFPFDEGMAAWNRYVVLDKEWRR